MKILGKTISDRTASIIVSIEKALPLPIDYFPIQKCPGFSGNSAGSVDAFGSNGIYRVWLNTSLPKDAFEADLLHELRHIIQIKAGYSTVYNKDSIDFHTGLQVTIENIGSLLSSVVLDVEVNSWLRENGYSYTYFTDNNYTVRLNDRSYATENINHLLGYSKFVLSLLHASLYVDDAASNKLFDAYASYSRASETAKRLREKIMNLPINTPQNAAIAHCYIIDTLQLWSYYGVLFQNKKIRTHKEFESFLGSVSHV